MQAQKILEDMLEKTLVMVKDPINVPEIEPLNDEGGIRLFKHAPPGIVFDQISSNFLQLFLVLFYFS